VLLTFVLAVDWVLAVCTWLAFAAMVLVWLKGFKVVDDKTRGVAVFGKYLGVLVEPALRPIRAVIPALGGIDGAPFVLILILMWVRYLMALYLIPRLT
jgi:YggT family protein